MNRDQKKDVIDQIVELLQGASGIYAVDYTGLTVAQAIRLRSEFKKAGVGYKVAKNTLIKRALQEVGGYDDVLERFKGMTGLAVGYDDPAGPARVLNEFIDPKVNIPQLRFAVLDSAYFGGEKLKELASMPSRKDVLAAIVGSINAPASGIVGAINAVMRDLASVIEEVAKQKAA